MLSSGEVDALAIAKEKLRMSKLNDITKLPPTVKNEEIKMKLSTTLRRKWQTPDNRENYNSHLFRRYLRT